MGTLGVARRSTGTENTGSLRSVEVAGTGFVRGNDPTTDEDDRRVMKGHRTPVGPLALALALGLERLRRDPVLDSLPPRSLAVRLGGLAFAAYFLAGSWAGPWHMTGDCPHYVIQAHSLESPMLILILLILL